MRLCRIFACFLLVLSAADVGANRATEASNGSFHFEILGDRTGSAVPGVFEEVWKEADAGRPAFILTVGDSIEGGDDKTAEAQWLQFERIVGAKHRYQLFLAPGNHDVWSAKSEALFVKHAHQPHHYSFDYRQVHFTVLDNSRGADGPSAQFSPDELDFLRKDLASHAGAKVKFVISHRPSWLFPVLVGNTQVPFHQIIKQYGVKYVIAGHIHQMLYFELDGVTYLDLASSGGHLRDTKQYERGWFFAHTFVSVEGDSAQFSIRELPAPFGKGRITQPSDWGSAGLNAVGTPKQEN
ncbi:MAG: metallophosphoesterase [Bryobacteraceae bacterium]